MSWRGLGYDSGGELYHGKILDFLSGYGDYVKKRVQGFYDDFMRMVTGMIESGYNTNRTARMTREIEVDGKVVPMTVEVELPKLNLGFNDRMSFNEQQRYLNNHSVKNKIDVTVKQRELQRIREEVQKQIEQQIRQYMADEKRKFDKASLEMQKQHSLRVADMQLEARRRREKNEKARVKAEQEMNSLRNARARWGRT